MSFEIAAGTFVTALKRVSTIVEKKTTIPILANVRIKATAGTGIEIWATDLDMESCVTVQADVHIGGDVTVNASIIETYLYKLPRNGVVRAEITLGSAQLVLSSGRSRATLQTLPAEDFPSFESNQFSTTIELPGSVLTEMFSAVGYAISDEATRYYLGGVYLHVRKNDAGQTCLSACATDGHRLSLYHHVMPDLADMPGVIVPRKTVGVLARLVEGSDAVSVMVSHSKIRVATETVVLTSKVIDGTFPDYERVIPSVRNAVAVVPRTQMAAVVDRVATICREKIRKMQIDITPGVMRLSMRVSETGDAEEDMAIEYDAEPLEIGMNARYLLDILASFDGADALSFALQDAGSPVVIRATDNANRLAVLMPMRV